VCSRQRYLLLGAPLPQRKDHRVHRDNQGQPEIPVVTQISAGWTIRRGPTSKDVRMIKSVATIKSALMIKDAAMTNGVPTRKFENVKTPVVQRESMFIQMPTEKRLASRTNRLTRSFDIQVESRPVSDYCCKA
jgi:hypothetical protein